MTAGLDRRTFVFAAAAMAAGMLLPLRPAAQPSRKTRLILLGTAGGPRPKETAFAPAQVIVVNDRLYVVDCGNGVAQQLARAKLALPNLRHVFITHHHSDHNADYGTLFLLAWSSGLATRVDAWGPPPLAEMTEHFFRMNAFDIATRIADEGRPPLRPLIQPNEIRAPGLVMQDDLVRVTCARANHPPITNAFGYRFDTADRSIVISGDTAWSDDIVALAKGADVLVHEALYAPGVDRVVARVPDASPRLKQHIMASHTTVEDCARIAAAAGVKTLVLSHLIPSDDPLITEQTWLDAARQHFNGRIVVGRDLLEI